MVKFYLDYKKKVYVLNLFGSVFDVVVVPSIELEYEEIIKQVLSVLTIVLSRYCIISFQFIPESIGYLKNDVISNISKLYI